MSREHIWPDGFLSRGSFGTKFSSRAGRTFEGDLVIRDVCEVCNNGPLSRLDAYACELYDASFGQFPEHSEPVRFTYEYSLLTRWLLKTAFNSARSQGHEDVELLARYRRMIIAEGDSCPLYANFYVALIGPGHLQFPDGRPAKKIYPLAARSGPMIIPNSDAYRHLGIRMLTVNGYFFTIILSRTPTVPIDEVLDLMSRLPGEPLALDGEMTLVTSMDANQALSGVERWPRGGRGAAR